MNLRSLQENVVETIEAFDDIAQVIEEKIGAEEGDIKDHIRPINYGNILRRLEFSGGDISLSQLTVYQEKKSRDLGLSAPVGGSVNLITGVITPPEGWSLTPYGNGEIWASTSIWNSGENQTGWSTPYLVSGSSGADGADGADGITPVISVSQDTDGIRYWTVNGNTLLDDSGNKVKAEGIDGVNLLSIEQTVESPEVDGINEITATMSNGNVSVFHVRNGSIGDTGPAGPQGEKGEDGSIYEYIYFRGFSSEDKPYAPTGGNNIDSFVPTDVKRVEVGNNTVILKWSSTAQGVDESYKFEWRSERKKEGNTWSNFSDPILWAKYGEKGKDGAGIQYIFTRTTEWSAPGDPTPSDWKNNSLYQNNEDDEYIPSGWTDDPVDVDEINAYCWVSVRKYRNDEWGPYSKPTLWLKWVESSNVTSDTITIDLEPDWAMINESEVAKTSVYAYKGNTTVIIKEVTVDESNCEIVNIHERDDHWNISVKVPEPKTSITPIKLNIKLSETDIRSKIFNIYHTQFDKETISVDFGDDNVLVPCADGQTPDPGFFDNFEIPVLMRVNGELVTIKSITPDKHTECFNMTSEGNLKVNSFPGNNQNASIKFTVSDGTNLAVGYVNFTKFNTQGGTLAMYTLNVHANDIVCNTVNNVNEYTVYTGKQGHSTNKILVSVNKYTSNEGNTIISVSDLPEKYAVFYANDPEDWAEDVNSTLNEYQKITNDGIIIGETISPDKCVSFQLREWTATGIPWTDNSEGTYKVWDTENILVDIVRDISAYAFVATPNKIIKDISGEISYPNDKCIEVGLTKHVAGKDPVSLTTCPTGYDIYYQIDGGDRIKFGEESENVTFPYSIDISSVTNAVELILVINENSEDDGMVVLSETIPVTSGIPGKSAYVAYLTDNMCAVSCDANGIPTAEQEYSTTVRVTNGTITNVTVQPYQYTGFKTTILDDWKIQISDFNQDLAENSHIGIIVEYTDLEGNVLQELLGYTIVKLKVADASTILHFSQNDVYIPCGEDREPINPEVKVTILVAMFHGDEALELTSEDIELGEPTAGYYPITFDVKSNLESDKWLTFTGTDALGKTWTRTGVISFRRLIMKSGKFWQLTLNPTLPKFNNDTDLFNYDFIRGQVDIWDSKTRGIATYQTLLNAGYYVVVKSNESGEYIPLKESDFAEDGSFRIYINPLDNNEDKTFVDLDTPAGIEVALAEYITDHYMIFQHQNVQACYDGRDFSKFELMLSDTTIYQTYKNGKQETVTPNEIKILGVYEYEGPKRYDYTGGKLHNKYVSGLDIYYCIDSDEERIGQNNLTGLEELKDLGNDGWVTNDTISVPIDTIKKHLDVYLVADYIVKNDETVKKIIDHKRLRVVPVELSVHAYHMELDQDELKVPINDDGTVDSGFTANISPYLYIEDDLQTVTFEYVFGSDVLPTEGWSNNRQFVANDFSNNSSYIWFKPKDKEIYKKCKITKERNPVEIFIDKHIVKRDLSSGLVNDTITVEVKKWNYTNNTWIPDVGYVVMKYKKVTGDEEHSYTVTATNNKYIVDLNNSKFENINYIRFEVTVNGKVGFEEVGVITDGRDGSSKEVLYYKSKGEIPVNPTPSNWDVNANYQNKELPSDWYSTEYTNCDNEKISTETAAKWVDEYPGVDETNVTVVYVCERKKTYATDSWGKFSEPKMYARYAKDGENGYGPVIYPAGEWERKTYIGNAQKAPYVSVTNGDNISYYIAYGSISAKPIDGVNTIDSTTVLDWNNPTNKWVKMENYNAIYADIGVLKQALVGKLVFHGDYMFSQYGTEESIKSGTSGSTGTWDEECDYSAFSDPATAINTGQFKPNVCINAKDGTFVTRSAEFNSDGSGYVGRYVDGDTLYKGLQWNVGSITLGNNLQVLPDGIVVSGDLSKYDHNSYNNKNYLRLYTPGYTNAQSFEIVDENGCGIQMGSCANAVFQVTDGSFTCPGDKTILFVRANSSDRLGLWVDGEVRFGAGTNPVTIKDGNITCTSISGSINNIKSVTTVANIYTSYPPSTTKYEYLQVHNNTSSNSTFTYNSSGSKVTLAPYATLLFKNTGTNWAYTY